MGVRFISGIPGSGKNLYVCYLLRKHHRSRFNKKMLKIVNEGLPPENQLKTLIFSNFPVLLDEKNNIYSNYISFDNMTIDEKHGFRLPAGAILAIDEAQKYFDSRDFKIFPKKTSIFMAHQRHAGIQEIYLLTQNPLRLDMKLRQLAEEFCKMHVTKMFLGICYMKVNTYYRDEDYGKPIPKKQFGGKVYGEVFDCKTKTVFFFTRPVFRAYDTKYFRFVFERLPLKEYKSFRSVVIKEEDLEYLDIDENLR